jgi:hypothetical protein
MSEWKLIRTKSEGLELIAKERERQIEVEGFTPEHDRQLYGGSLAAAAGCYALYDWSRKDCERLWPWDRKWWKPSDDKIRNLVKAGALIAAEIDRLHEINECEGGNK